MKRAFMKTQIDGMGDLAQVLKDLRPVLALQGALVDANDADDEIGVQYTMCHQLLRRTMYYRGIWSMMTGQDADFCDIPVVVCEKNVKTKALRKEAQSVQAEDATRMNKRGAVAQAKRQSASKAFIDRWGKNSCGSNKQECGYMNPDDYENFAIDASNIIKLQCAKFGSKKDKMCIATYDKFSTKDENGGATFGPGADNLGAIKLGGKCFATEECRYVEDPTAKILNYNPTKVPVKYKCMECKNYKCVQKEIILLPPLAGTCAGKGHRWDRYKSGHKLFQLKE